MFGGRGGGGRGRGRGGGGDLNRRGLPKQLEGPPPNFMPDSTYQSLTIHCCIDA